MGQSDQILRGAAFRDNISIKANWMLQSCRNKRVRCIIKHVDLSNLSRS